MHVLTQNRLAKAAPILERYHLQLIHQQYIDCLRFERELCECWNLEFTDLKNLFVQLLHLDRFTFLAAYYMQYENPDRPNSQYLRHLAKLYGVKYYDDADRKRKQSEFWLDYFVATDSYPMRPARQNSEEAQVTRSH